MDDAEILECLKRNADNKKLFEFTKDIFMFEFVNSGNWNSNYDKIIEEYSKD